MFFVTSGMNLFAFIFIAVILVCLLYAFVSAVRGFGGGSMDDETLHGHWQCGGPNCLATNPPHARFCRMCGRRRD